MSSEGDEPFEYDEQVICVHDSGEALKVTPVHLHKPIPFWVPKSVIHDDSEVYEKGGEGKLVVKTWWAQKEWG